MHGVLYILRERGQPFLEGQLPVGLLDRANLFLQRMDSSFHFPLARFVGGYLIGRRQRMIVIDIREEHGHEAVVIGLQDRIELVIVAARASHREAEKGARSSADRIIEVNVAVLRIILLAEADRGADAIEAGGDEGVIAAVVQLIAGYLLADEAVVGLILVQGADDVIAIAP